MDVVPIYDRGEKRRIEVDRKVGKWDSNSVGRSECHPTVRHHGGHTSIFLNNECACTVWRSRPHVVLAVATARPVCEKASDNNKGKLESRIY